MKRAFLHICLCFLASVGWTFGQIDPEETRDHIIVKWSPLSMFDIDNTIMFGLEVPLGERFAIQQDMGYGSAKFNIWYYNMDVHKNTYKSRSQLKYYFLQRPKWRSYVAAEYIYKKVVYQDNQWVGRGCADGSCDFYQDMRVKQGRFVSAFHSKIGWQFYFSNRTTIDVFAGLGFRYIQNRMITEDVEDVTLGEKWYFWENNNPGYRQTIPSPQVGFQIGIGLGKYKK